MGSNTPYNSAVTFVLLLFKLCIIIPVNVISYSLYSTVI